MASAAEKVREEYRTVEENNNDEMETAWDDPAGAALRPVAVRAARAQEINYARTMGLYKKVPVSERVRKTGEQPISVRWIDNNKGDMGNPDHPSRFVAREFNIRKNDDPFAAAPPLEARKTILLTTAGCNTGEVTMINDISRAFVHAKRQGEVFVQFPSEDVMPGERRMCGRLGYTIYGTRGAAQNWFEEYSQMSSDIGCKPGLATPCVLYRAERALPRRARHSCLCSTAQSLPFVLVYTGTIQPLERLKQQLEKRYQVKTQVCGPEEEHLKEVKILNRMVGWNGQEGISYEVDPTHAEAIIEQFGLKASKLVSSPGTIEEGRTQLWHENKLDDNESSKFRAIVARCNYIATDRPDMACAVKGLA